MTNSLTNPKGAQRYILRVGHSDDAGLGAEGWVVRMSDHFSSCDTAQKWIKEEDYERLWKALERIAFEPFGDAEAGPNELLYNIERIAKETLGINAEQTSPAVEPTGDGQ